MLCAATEAKPEHLYRDVSLNLANTILENRDVNKKRAHWAPVQLDERTSGAAWLAQQARHSPHRHPHRRR